MTDPKAAQTLALTGRLTALLAGALLCARAVVDPDLWGHLTFGSDILESGHVTSIDPYSFTQDVPWVNHEWLSELLFAIAYRAGGVAGLILLKTVIIAGVLALLWRSLAPPLNPSVRWWTLALLAFALAPAATSFRPQLWTLLALSLLVFLLSNSKTTVWALPVFALWANLHGGWIVGAGFVSCWLAGRLLDRVPLVALAGPALALFASVAATIVNPYGVGLWRFLASTVRTTREITEWRPVWEQSDPSFAVLWLLTVAALLYTLRRCWRAVTWSALLPSASLCIGALLVARLGPLFAIASVLVFRDGWSATCPDGAVASSERPAAPSLWLVDAAAVAVIWLLIAGLGVRCLPIVGPWVPDLIAARALDTALPGRLVVPFNWGEYAIWHWGPTLRVSMDGRRETVYSPRMLALHDAVEAATPEGITYVLRERPEYVWLKIEAAAMRAALVDAGYRIDVTTQASFIATRDELPPLRSMEPMSSCFP